MRKLLRADFARLWRSRIFQISLAVMFLIGVAVPIEHYLDGRNTGNEWTLETGFFTYAIFLVILLSPLLSLFVGTEYSDGTIRNKIVVGHRRWKLYLSNLIVCVTAGALLCAAHLIPYLALGIPLLGFFTCGAGVILLHVAAVFAMTIATAALFMAIAMLCQSRAHTVAACILLAFSLLFAAVYLNSTLEEPEYYDAYVYTENGITTAEDQERNTNYVSGTKREVYEFLLDFIPGGQAYQLACMKAEHPGRLALYDLIILVVVTGGGIAAFRRKDLK